MLNPEIQTKRLQRETLKSAKRKLVKNRGENMRVINDINENEYLEQCPICHKYLAYGIKDVKKSGYVYYFICPNCGEFIPVEWE